MKLSVSLVNNLKFAASITYIRVEGMELTERYQDSEYVELVENSSLSADNDDSLARSREMSNQNYSYQINSGKFQNQRKFHDTVGQHRQLSTLIISYSLTELLSYLLPSISLLTPFFRNLYPV